jgi:hypothetical protein
MTVKNASNKKQNRQKKWIAIVSSLIDELYGDTVCKKALQKRIVIYIPPSLINDSIFNITEKLSKVISENIDLCDIENFESLESMSVVFEDGIKRSCEWTLKEFVELKRLTDREFDFKVNNLLAPAKLKVRESAY